MNDPAVAHPRGETQIELHIRAVIKALHEQGIPASDIRCISCHARLIDLAHITVTPRGPLCPECIDRPTSITRAMVNVRIAHGESVSGD